MPTRDSDDEPYCTSSRGSDRHPSQATPHPGRCPHGPAEHHTEYRPAAHIGASLVTRLQPHGIDFLLTGLNLLLRHFFAIEMELLVGSKDRLRSRTGHETEEHYRHHEFLPRTIVHRHPFGCISVYSSLLTLCGKCRGFLNCAQIVRWMCCRVRTAHVLPPIGVPTSSDPSALFFLQRLDGWTQHCGQCPRTSFPISSWLNLEVVSIPRIQRGPSEAAHWASTETASTPSLLPPYCHPVTS